MVLEVNTAIANASRAISELRRVVQENWDRVGPEAMIQAVTLQVLEAISQPEHTARIRKSVETHMKLEQAFADARIKGNPQYRARIHDLTKTLLREGFDFDFYQEEDDELEASSTA